MKAKYFLGHNVVFAKDQPEYKALPAHLNVIDPTGTVTLCFKLTDKERKQVADKGELWIQQVTFQQPFQPMQATVEKPTLKTGGKKK